MPNAALLPINRLYTSTLSPYALSIYHLYAAFFYNRITPDVHKVYSHALVVNGFIIADNDVRWMMRKLKIIGLLDRKHDLLKIAGRYRSIRIRQIIFQKIRMFW
jgi:hypothetical protein